MKAVVTGGAGFIGSHLVEELVNRGIEVHIIDNLVSGKHHNIHPLAIFYPYDICSPEAKKAIMDIHPDCVFHLAAQADVSKSIKEPLYDAQVNISGTINILEACRDASVQKIIFASTSAVYGNFQAEIVSTEDPAQPISYYGLSKLSAENYIRVFSQLYGLNYSILRYGNVYGPRQQPKGEGGVIAVFLQKLKENVPLSIHGDGEQSRDFIYVKDVVSANIAAMKNGHQETLHVSTGKSTSINNLVRVLEDLHPESIKARYTSARFGDIKHSCLENSHTCNLLKWDPQYDILEGLKETYVFVSDQS
ncbi:NAD-dependent epimerase/dehydratase family protein [Bacillus lacus]|uniref:NAD-dependent epimerase/dehydratase family protein n=1 Tax=Metabacillus lacus TaxID=1983721 RepID=A0A7X2J2T5_9BACI|nr:NAD-dependent epimerase/dehydratase family protein [Metabacillus lacus]MRX74249.1 NAD-dependent epimerase/dehydratase family protein [Metabacillus lacus]